MTYQELYNQFLKKTNMDISLISDYRPCCELYNAPNIANAILVWLRSGERLIFIAN